MRGQRRRVHAENGGYRPHDQGQDRNAMGARPPLVHGSLIADGHLCCLGIRTNGLYGWRMSCMEIWFNPACSKCRVAQEMLDEAGADYAVRRYLDAPPTAAEIVEVLDRLGLEPWDITRMGEPLADELGLAERPRERDDWIDLLATNPSLIQRPIILTADGSAWVARSPEEVEKALAAEGG